MPVSLYVIEMGYVSMTVPILVNLTSPLNSPYLFPAVSKENTQQGVGATLGDDVGNTMGEEILGDGVGGSGSGVGGSGVGDSQTPPSQTPLQQSLLSLHSLKLSRQH
jgi:hypothetical protein